ncbi:MAG: hypothetical protein JST89_03880 [Cyanobacteria bacterium SZAS-4]|nr:hypothetical protein [Cyanobacteria bacterium SZAS-4]
MKKSKLALVAFSLCILAHAPALAATEESLQEPSPDETVTSLTKLALVGVNDLGGFLTSDLAPPSAQSESTSEAQQSPNQQVAIGGTDGGATSGSENTSTTGAEKCRSPHAGPGMSKCGFGMRGGHSPMWGHFRCPWTRLEGSNALTDAQYQKLYDIKGQFIASVVPKGLNVWMLARKMKDLLESANVDNSAVKDVEKQIAAATSDISITAMDTIISANQVLTPEQRKELHTMSIRSTLGGSGRKSHSDK